MFSSSYTPSRRGRVPAEDSDDEAATNQLRNEMEAAHDDDDEEYESSEDTKHHPENSTLLNEDPFGNEESQKMFESIDKLRKCGAGQDLDLPQLVIVGKQSAGKSSLLQSLTDIPFPVGSRLCTQFALRIVSRRTAPGSKNRAHASIEPGDVNPFTVREDDRQIKDFAREIFPFTAEAFEELIEDAKDAMGISAQGTSEDRNYSSKVLKIELSGPNRSHFGILDLPGVFSAEIGGVSSREKEGVTRMVKSYMSKPENIIICVADASGDISNENILPLARDIDSSRIVGVFTKCDKADPPIDIVNHVTNPDGLGGKHRRWYVVQNRKPKADASSSREAEEQALFSQAPWTDIPPEQRGTAMLKKHLASLLCRRIRDAFPGMLNTVTKLLDAEKQRRKGMGESRVDHLHKQAYLMRIVDSYRTLALQAWKSPTEVEEDDMKLKGLVVGMDLAFETKMKSEGHFFKFVEIGESTETVRNENDDGDSDSGSDSDLRNIQPPDLFSSTFSPDRRRPMRTPPRGNAVRRRGLYTPSQSPPREEKATTTQIQKSPLYLEIRRQINLNRGEELPGMLNPSVLKPLLRKQTSKWFQLAEDYLNNVINTTTKTALKLFDKACSDSDTTPHTRTGLEDRILSFSEDSRTRVLAQLKQLCDRNARMALHTDTHDFLHAVRQAQISRFTAALTRYKSSNPASSFIRTLQTPDNPKLAAGPEAYENWAVVDVGFVDGLFNEIHPQGDRAQNVEDEIHDLLRAYYELARRSFVHDVIHNIAEPFVQDSTGPLLGLNTEFVLRLSEAEVEHLGGEDECVVVGRREVDDRIARLEAAGRIARSPLGEVGV